MVSNGKVFQKSTAMKVIFPLVGNDLLIKIWSYTCDKENGTKIIVLDDLSNLSLDIIGDVGYGYQFNTLTSHSGNEFTKAFQSYCQLQYNIKPIYKALSAFFPFLMGLSIMFGKRKKTEEILRNNLNMVI
nr:uncharacterized protein LOC124818234 [Hydra vulgaris]